MGRIEIIAGTYEEFLLGYFLTKENTLEQTFAAHEHTGSIRTISISGDYLASGGADDRIFVYDLKTRKEICSLAHHNSTVTALAFTPKHTHLISGSADGVLAIVRVGNWQLEKIWQKPHKGAALLDIAVHDSGKLALTLGTDGTLCTWNLIEGRQAYVVNLNSKSKDAKSIERILWSEDGVRFALYGGRFVEIWSIENGGMLDFVDCEEKVTSCLWFTGSSLLIGYESGSISLVDLDDKDRKSFKAHNARVKSLKMHKDWIVSISSNGEIKVWNQDFEELSSLDTGCRLTCLELMPTKHVKIEKQEVLESEDAKVDAEEESTFKPYVVIEDPDDEVREVKTEPLKKKKRQNVVKEEPVAQVSKKCKKKKVKNVETDSAVQLEEEIRPVSTRKRNKKRKNKS